MDTLKLISGAIAILGFIGLFVGIKTQREEVFIISVIAGLLGGIMYFILNRFSKSKD